jgi:hypothetical protein
MKAVKMLADFMGAAAQGAVAAGTGGKPAAKESLYIQSRPLSEGQVYMLFNRIEQLNEGPIDWLKKKAGNLTNNITADKLNSAWTKAGSPTDSGELEAFLGQQGVDAGIIDQTFKAMKLPTGGAAAPAADPAVDPTMNPAKTQTLYAQVKSDISKLDSKSRKRIIAYLEKQIAAAPRRAAKVPAQGMVK